MCDSLFLWCLLGKIEGQMSWIFSLRLHWADIAALLKFLVIYSLSPLLIQVTYVFAEWVSMSEEGGIWPEISKQWVLINILFKAILVYLRQEKEYATRTITPLKPRVNCQERLLEKQTNKQTEDSYCTLKSWGWLLVLLEITRYFYFIITRRMENSVSLLLF